METRLQVIDADFLIIIQYYVVFLKPIKLEFDRGLMSVARRGQSPLFMHIFVD